MVDRRNKPSRGRFQALLVHPFSAIRSIPPNKKRLEAKAGEPISAKMAGDKFPAI
jgi:hypothetical protein